jgi:hypothetical protein
MLDAGASMREVYAETVEETRRTYAGTRDAEEVKR